MDEVKRRTETVDEMMKKVITAKDGDLTAVGRAVRDVNETLAVHAAWTDERFESVGDRLVSLARILVMTSSKVEMQLAGIDSRLAALGVGQSGLAQALSRVEQNQLALLQRDTDVLQRIDRLAQNQEALQQGLAVLAQVMTGLTERVGELLAYAVSGELAEAGG